MGIKIADAIQLPACQKSGLFRYSSHASIENRKRDQLQKAFLLFLSYFVQPKSGCDNEQNVLLMRNAVLKIGFLVNAFQKDWFLIIIPCFFQAEDASDLHCAATAEWQFEYLHNFLQVYHLVVHFNAQIISPLKRTFLMQCLNNGCSLSHGVPLSWPHLPHLFSLLKEAIESIFDGAALLLEEGCDYIMLLNLLLVGFEISPQCLCEGHLRNANETAPADI